MKINEPLTPEQHSQVQDINKKIESWQNLEFEKIAKLIEANEPLSYFHRKLATAKMRAGKPSFHPLKRPRGKGPIIPEIALVVHEALVSHHGFTKAEAEELLAQKFGVDPETFRSRIRRLRKKGDLLAEAVLLTARSGSLSGA